MPQTVSKKFNAQWFGLITRATGAVAATVILGACSQVPDAVNPVEWYNSTVEFFSGYVQLTPIFCICKTRHFRLLK